MNDDLRQKISAAIDAPGGIAADAGLAAELAEDADALAYARELERVDAALREWPLPDRGDEAWDSLATRIEQRLDERLVTLPDPTLAPSFEVADARHELALKAGPKPPRPAPAPYKIAEISSLGTKDGESAEAKAVRPAPPAGPSPADKGGEKQPPPPPPPSAKRSAPTPAAGLPLPRAKSGPPERFSLSEVLPPTGGRGPAPDRFTLTEVVEAAPGTAGLSGGTQLASEKKRLPRIAWIGGGLAAAAGFALVIVLASSGGAPSAEMAAQASPTGSSSEPALATSPVAVTPGARPTADLGMPAGPGEASGMGSAEAPVGAAAAPPPMPMPMAPTTPPAAAGATRAPATATPAVENTARPGHRAVSPHATTATERTPRGPAAGGTTEQGTAGAPTAPGAATTSVQRPHTPRGGAGDSPPDPGNLPEAPDRDAVLNALNAVRPAVLACAEGRSGVATVQVTVASTGRVSGALVSGVFAGTPQGSCIARAVRGARFPRFTRPTFSVTFPFPL